MNKIERFYFLKYINAAYQISFAENAVNTQEYLSKLISFFRYYFNEQEKLVRLKEELKQVELFSEIHRLMSGKKINLVFDVQEDVNNVYMSANSISRCIQDITINTNISEVINWCLEIKGFIEEHNAFIIISMNYIRSGDALSSNILALKDILGQNFEGPLDINYSFDADSKIEIRIKIPVQN